MEFDTSNNYADRLYQKVEIEKKLSELCPENCQINILNGISNQRLFYIKNKPKFVFDSHSGYIFPNPQYYEPCDFKLDFIASPESIIKKVSKSMQYANELHWIYPSEGQLRIYIDSICAINELTKVLLLPTIDIKSQECATDKTKLLLEYENGYSNLHRIDVSNTDVIAYNKIGGELFDADGNYARGRKHIIAYPFIDFFHSKDLSPDNKVFTPQERAQKVLNLFIQEGWIPKFDDEELTKLYEKMYVTRPALIKQLAEINEALAAMPAPKLGFADGIDFNVLIKEYDLAIIRNSHVQYYAETIRWFDNLLTNLDAFIHEHSDLLSEAQTLTNRLTVAHHDDEYPVLTERAEYLVRHLDFGVETLQSELIAFKNEAVAGRDVLANARNLASLREIEKQERPDFYLVAEHTADMVKRQLAGVDWFREHKELAATLIDLHETWRDDFHLFEHTTRDHFIKKCRDESIPEEQADGWFAEWRKERVLLEEHLLPLMKAGIDKVIPVEVVIEAVDVLKTAILDRLGRFFFDERIALHQKFAFEPGGVIQERFEKEAELTKINSEFQKKLEDLVFNVDASEGRLFLVRWAKDWYDSLIGDMLAFIEKDTLQEQIARDTLDEFRAMKRRNLEAFLMDTRSYAAARELIDKQWNSLVFRMRSDLVKKNGKASS